MHPVPVDTCLRCFKPRTLPAFSVAPVTPSCACTGRNSELASVQFEEAVQEVLELYRVEHQDDDAPRVVMRLNHVASCAGEAWVNKDQKFYVSCLVSSVALSRLLLERVAVQTGKDEADEPASVAGARASDP